MDYSLQKRISDGIKLGVNKHWRYTKNLIKVKPEYLLIVSVADEITKGFSEFHGMEVEIKLEEPTKRIIGHVLMGAVGMKKYFKTDRPILTRKGRVDIFLECDSECHVVELKNFDTSSSQLRKEVVRIQELLSINSWKNPLKAGYIAFPTMTNCASWIESELDGYFASDELNHSVDVEYIETGEDPENGIPAYYTNVVKLEKKSA